MLSREDVLMNAADDCLKTLYSYAQPKVEWDDFKKECEEYSKKYMEWERMDRNDRPELIEFCGPKPYEFYYLPSDFTKEIVDSYIYAYKIDSQTELKDTVHILKDYFNNPIVDKYIDEYTDEYGLNHPGHRDYDHPDNIKKRMKDLLCQKYNLEEKQSEDASEDLRSLIDEFFDMATGFFNWNRDLNAFSVTVYLGVSPTSNKDAAIENWKKYRGKDIVIDESIYKDDEYDDEYETDEPESIDD